MGATLSKETQVEGAAVNNTKIEHTPVTPEELLRKEQKQLRKNKRSRVRRALDRICGFLVATVLLGLVAGLGLEYILVKGPSPALSEAFTMTMLETRRFGWIPNIFLPADEVDAMNKLRFSQVEAVYDPSLVTINTQAEPTETQEEAPNPYGDYDEDGDGIILENVTGNGYIGYMIKILDPTRVFVGRGGAAYPLAEMCQAYGALGGINGGGFLDENGGGDGNTPNGLTIINGEIINYGYESNSIAGITREGRLVIGYYSAQDAMDLGITGCATFTPILVMNGQPMDLSSIPSSLNPRTAIGQRADGCILMLVIDGRQVHSYGATYEDLQNVMLEFGAVNALNLDGGSSTTMWYNGAYVNSCSSANGIARPIPTGFLFR